MNASRNPPPLAPLFPSFFHQSFFFFLFSCLFFLLLLSFPSFYSIPVEYPPLNAWTKDFFHSHQRIDYEQLNYSKKNLAIVVNTQIYHYEVFASLVYYLHTLGFLVHGWVQPPWSGYQFRSRIDWIHPYLDGIVYLPHRTYNSTTWQGRPNPLPKHIRLLIYVTGDFYADIKQMCRLQLHQRLFQRSEHVMIITHHADTINKEMFDQCHGPKCVITFLASHVEDSARRLHYQKGNVFPIETSTVFPVFHLPDYHYLTNSNNSSSSSSIDGNSLATSTSPPPAASTTTMNGKNGHTITSWDYERSRKIIIQGQVESHRRDYHLLFDCIRTIHHQNPLHQQQPQQPPQHLHSSHLPPTKMIIHLSIMGNGAKELSIPSFLLNHPNTTTIHRYDNLKFEDYFQMITKQHFIISFVPQINLTEYSANRISSSVSAAVIAETPIILPFLILQQYPCLNTSEIHMRVARQTDCESLQKAFTLSYEEYIMMKNEIRICKEQWIRKSRKNIRSIVTRKPSYGNSNVSYVVPRGMCDS